MNSALHLDSRVVADVCARHGVRRLRLFGSAVTPDFDPENSDVDFLVDFRSGRSSRVDDYFGLRAALESLTGRPVDLVTADSLANPFFRHSVLSSAEDVYVG